MPKTSTEIGAELERFTFEKAWNDYAAVAIPKHAGDAQIAAMRDAFLCGAFTYAKTCGTAMFLPAGQRDRIIKKFGEELDREVTRVTQARMNS